jgi:hypothetical protein
MSAKVGNSGTGWSAAAPTKVLAPGYWSSFGGVGVQYDVSADGKRFLVIEPPKNATPDLVVVQHWDEELKASARSK